MTNIVPSLSEIWLKVINLEQRIFPQWEASFGPLSPKDSVFSELSKISLHLLQSLYLLSFSKYEGFNHFHL